MYKLAADTLPVTVDFFSEVQPRVEDVTAIVSCTVQPANQLVLSTPVIVSPAVTFSASGGQDGVNYLIQLVVTTSQGRVLTRDVFVAVAENIPQPVQSPDTYRTIIDEVFAGESVRASASLVLDDAPDTTGMSGSWEILDSDGVQYAQGGCIDLRSQYITNVGTKVEVFAVVTVPSNLPPAATGTKYQLRWTIAFPSEGTRTHLLFDNFSVRSPVQAPNAGSLNSVELASTSASLGIVLQQKFDHVQFQLFYEANAPLSEVVQASQYMPLSTGHYYSQAVDTSQIQASLFPYIAVWQYWLDAYPNMKYSDAGQCYIINPSIASAMADLRSFCNKINEQDFVTPWDLMSYLRTGADEFNSYGNPTEFTMTNAQQGIRAGWLMFAQVRLLRARYLEEGSKSFEFSGSAVQLSQDRTQYLQTIADSITGQISDTMNNFKANLAMRGTTSGDGSTQAFSRGSSGSLGLTMSPVSRYGTSGRQVARLILLGR